MVFSRSQCGRKAATTANARLIAHKRHPAELALNANNEAQWKYNGNQEFVYRLKCEKYLYLPSALGLGIIPANAGSLNSWQSRLWYTESSPGMQGAQTQLNDGTFVVGIIPADARSTDLGARYSRRIQDHPHGCGEHITFRTVTRPVRGSSPRMRGTPWKMIHGLVSKGIIPTDAGSTSVSWR